MLEKSGFTTGIQKWRDKPRPAIISKIRMEYQADKSMNMNNRT